MLPLSGLLWNRRYFRGGMLSVLPLLVLSPRPHGGLLAGEIPVHLLWPGDIGQIPAQGQTDMLYHWQDVIDDMATSQN